MFVFSLRLVNLPAVSAGNLQRRQLASEAAACINATTKSVVADRTGGMAQNDFLAAQVRSRFRVLNGNPTQQRRRLLIQGRIPAVVGMNVDVLFGFVKRTEALEKPKMSFGNVSAQCTWAIRLKRLVATTMHPVLKFG